MVVLWVCIVSKGFSNCLFVRRYGHFRVRYLQSTSHPLDDKVLIRNEMVEMDPHSMNVEEGRRRRRWGRRKEKEGEKSSPMAMEE